MDAADAAGAQEQAWRVIRAVLAGEPVPAAAGDAQAVVAALARIAAHSIAARLEEIGAEVIAKGLALGYVEHKLSALLLADVLCPPGEPPG
jgi:hypothetical protein